MSEGIAGSGIELGITLYSLTSEFAAGLYTPETLIKAVADEGLGPGVEFNIAQMLRTYPDVDDDFIRLWRDSMDRYGLTPSAVGTNLDMGRRKDRDMTPDEEYDFFAAQLNTANKLGFHRVVIRSAGKELLRRLLPLAEKYDQKLGYEIHAPQGPNDPKILQIREMYAELGSDRLGFTADFSSTMHSLSPTLFRTLTQMGLPEEHFAVMQDIWRKPLPMQERNQEFEDYLSSNNFDPARLGPFTRLAFNMHGLVPPEEWLDSCRRSSTSTRSSTTSTATATNRRWTFPALCGSSSRAATRVTSPANGRATPSPTSANPTRSTSSRSSTRSCAVPSKKPLTPTQAFSTRPSSRQVSKAHGNSQFAVPGRRRPQAPRRHCRVSATALVPQPVAVRR
jgi:hypothetical protein